MKSKENEKKTNLLKWVIQELQQKKSAPGRKIEALEKLTVIIPSYKRQDFIFRQVAYWSGEEAKIVVLDGSDESLSEEIIKYISLQSNMKYIHEPISIYSRLKLARKYITTPYVVLLGDDEFHLKSGLSKAIEKLDAEPSLVACIGQSLSFRVSYDGHFVSWGAGYPHYKYEVTQNSPADRLIYAMSNYNAASCYAVIRKEDWLRSYTNLQPFTSVYAGEIQQAIITYGAGKLGSVDSVYWLRSGENGPVPNDATWDRRLSFVDWWSLPKFQSERMSFVEGLSNKLKLAASLTDSDSKSIVLDSIQAFIESNKNKTRGTSTVELAAKWARLNTGSILKSILPLRFFKRLQNFFQSTLQKQKTGDLENLSKLLQRQPTSWTLEKDEIHSELVNIEKLLFSFYKARFSRG